MDREIISKLEKEVQRTYSIKTTVFRNGEKVSEEINTHREPCVRIPIETADKILALLKEQEAITIKKTKEHGFGVYGGICPKCRNWIQSAHSYCGFCGQAVKWE